MKPLDDARRAEISGIIERHRAELARLPGFVAVEPGLPIAHGWIVKEPAIIVYVEHKKPRSSLRAGDLAPRTLEGVRVDVVQADPERQLALNPATRELAAALDTAAVTLTYRRLAGNPIDQEFSIEKPMLCHVGPDAGWPVLKRFLEGTRDSLSVAIYDFNADWIASTFIDTIKDTQARVVLTWDDGMTGDEGAVRRQIKAELGDQLDAWIVECGGDRRFASAYHEKVAVRDSQSFWLSSGNWSKRSQPDVDPIADPDSARGMYSKGNREWHVVVDDVPLAKLFETYIHYDRDSSEAEDTVLGVRAPARHPDLFVPIEVLTGQDLALAIPTPAAPARLPSTPRRVKVRPVLSPDNYLERIMELIQAARQRLYLQYSYITYSSSARDQQFRKLLDLVGELTNREDVDVRIIVGSSGAQEKIPKLIEAGFNDSVIRVQGNIHNKGIIVDGNIVLVSSANWSSDGVLRNRDAGLIIHDREIAQYYERIFLDDWEQRARASIDSAAAAVRIAPAGAATPPGMVRMTWDDYYGE